MKVIAYFDILASHTEQKKEKAEEIIKKAFSDIKGQLEKNEKIKILKTEEAEILEREIDIQGNKIKAWSSFLKAELEINNIEDLFDFVLWYSPSRLEINGLKEARFNIDGKEIKLTGKQFNEILNSISARIIELTRILLDLNTRYQIAQEIIKKYLPREAQKLDQPK